MPPPGDARHEPPCGARLRRLSLPAGLGGAGWRAATRSSWTPPSTPSPRCWAARGERRLACLALLLPRVPGGGWGLSAFRTPVVLARALACCSGGAPSWGA
eukprot:1192131-Lingulodinium_polyedra.AAC.1